MKAKLLNRSITQSRSFILEEHTYDNFLKVWHYHPEVELVIICESTGTRFVGDSIEKFRPGEIILLGKNLPHLWLNDEVYFEENSGLFVKAYVVHFYSNFRNGIQQIPEMNFINTLFERAARGIKFEGDSNQKIIDIVQNMFQLSDNDKSIALLDVIKHLFGQEKYKLLSSTGYVDLVDLDENNKIEPVYKYIFNNFTQNICLNRAAELANMHPSSFSRYFKRVQKKTFTRFITEIRIGYACKLLIEEKYSISEICYKSGFNNISNFNRHFKLLKDMTPTQFINKFSNIE